MVSSKGTAQLLSRELYFINAKNEILQGQTDSLKCTAIDGNPLTNFHLHEYLTIHFDSAVNVNKLVCLPRNDGNGIYPGNVYELFYFEQDGWQSPRCTRGIQVLLGIRKCTRKCFILVT